jgi:hypothetical protein
VQVTKRSATQLARMLDVGLRSPGVCPACLSFVAFEIEDGTEQRVAGQITFVAPLLWDEGLGESVRRALRAAVRDCASGARDALQDLETRRARSAIFRAVVRRLAAELAEDARRSYFASLN